MGMLDGRVAIITGASKGIGRALALRFGREGAGVICAARSADLVKETTAEVNGAGNRAIAFTGDLSREEDVRRLVAAGLEAFGKIDALVNNAGDGGPTKPVQDYTVEDWRYTIDSCLTSSYLCIRFVVPEMIKAGGGAIVNISSVSGFVGQNGIHMAYNASKGAVRLMTKSAAVQYARKGIRVNSVHPGVLPAMRSSKATADPAFREKMLAGVPMRREGRVEEVAYAVLFLASDEASYITGTELVVDGGWLAV